nr:hypothetical protein [Tanacetum cinerariifolium]
DSRLVHALDNGRAGAENDEEVEHERLRPSVCLLVPEDVLFLLGQLADVLVSVVSLAHARDECTFAEGILVFGEAPLETPG